MNLKVGKFYARVFFTCVLMGVGTAIFFSIDSETMRIIGSNMVTAGWAAWMSMGSSKITSPETEYAQLEGITIDSSGAVN